MAALLFPQVALAAVGVAGCKSGVPAVWHPECNFFFWCFFVCVFVCLFGECFKASAFKASPRSVVTNETDSVSPAVTEYYILFFLFFFLFSTFLHRRRGSVRDRF